MSATKTEEWAERVGREAVAEGMPRVAGMLGTHGSRIVVTDGGPRSLVAYHDEEGGGDLHWFSSGIPDFRDRLTEKACELWVEDVAREVYGERLDRVDFTAWRIGGFSVCVYTAEDERAHVECEAATVAEACIAGVRAMRGAG